MTKLTSSVWETDKNRKRFLNKSKQELRNASKRFKEKKLSVQIRITKDAYDLLKHHAWNYDKTIVTAASNIIEGILERGDEAPYLYDFL